MNEHTAKCTYKCVGPPTLLQGEDRYVIPPYCSELTLGSDVLTSWKEMPLWDNFKIITVPTLICFCYILPVKQNYTAVREVKKAATQAIVNRVEEDYGEQGYGINGCISSTTSIELTSTASKVNPENILCVDISQCQR